MRSAVFYDGTHKNSTEPPHDPCFSAISIQIQPQNHTILRDITQIL
jgi:hypothetical protein